MKQRMKKIFTVIQVCIVAAAIACSSITCAAEAEDGQDVRTNESYTEQLIRTLGGGDGLYKQGLNGIDMFDYLGLVYMGWRTTGGVWQNYVINDFIMKELEEAGYATTDANVEAPYGTKPESDKSSATDADYAWIVQYQETKEHLFGDTWDPEYSSLQVQLVKEDGTPAGTAEETALAQAVSGEWWGYNPTTEVYQKHFANEFGMNYETDLAALPDTEARVKAMHEVLMTSDVEKDSRIGVDDYNYIKRESIDRLNKEAVLNKRTRLGWESCFTDPAGTDPKDAKGLDGEFVYVGTIDQSKDTNSEGIDPKELAGKILLADSSLWVSFAYAYQHGAVGVASKYAVESYLCPKAEDGTILDPWYDSSRYSPGADLDDTVSASESGKPVVEWQFSNRQYDSLKALLERANRINEETAQEAEKVKVTGHQVAIGQVYPMTKKEGDPGVGQAVAIAEVKGSVHPEKRILICAHVQEPGCNDNATGVAALLGMATAYKKMVDAGTIERPKCTITFLWGDEMNMADYWMDGHEEETTNLIAALDMDMVGEDPEKTGGVMRIEKTPDPSATGGYNVDAVPWEDPDDSIPSASNPYYDQNYKSSQDGSFVRLPDSHTLWGAEDDIDVLFRSGWYLNDLYMHVTNTVSSIHDSDFRVEVCPYEGGSDHSAFLQRKVPALLTWHFTDYVYHTSSDTLYMASPREMESVAITTLASALLIGDSCDNNDLAKQVLGAIEKAALDRMDTEKINTEHHLQYVLAGNDKFETALANEVTLLKAWGDWYAQAIESVATLTEEPSEELKNAISAAKEKLAKRVKAGLEYAEQTLKEIDIEGAYVVLSKSEFTYNGSVRKPVIRSVGGREQKEGTDYTAVISDKSGRVVKEPKNAGTYTITITGKGRCSGKTTAAYQILKAKNPLKIKGKTASVNYSKTKSRTLRVSRVITFLKKGKGTMTYTKVKGNKKIKIDKKTGRVTVKKGLKKGTYKVEVKVKAKGTSNYKAATKKAVFRIKVN